MSLPNIPANCTTPYSNFTSCYVDEEQKNFECTTAPSGGTTTKDPSKVFKDATYQRKTCYQAALACGCLTIIAFMVTFGIAVLIGIFAKSPLVTFKIITGGEWRKDEMIMALFIWGVNIICAVFIIDYSRNLIDFEDKYYKRIDDVNGVNETIKCTPDVCPEDCKEMDGNKDKLKGLIWGMVIFTFLGGIFSMGIYEPKQGHGSEEVLGIILGPGLLILCLLYACTGFVFMSTFFISSLRDKQNLYDCDHPRIVGSSSA